MSRCCKERYRIERFPFGGSRVDTLVEEEDTTGLRFRVLGPLEADRDGESVNLGGPKPRALLAALVIAEGHPVRMDRLIDVLWGDQPPATATKSIQKYVSQLRKYLNGALTTQPDGYSLDVPDDHVDARRFERLVHDAGAADRPERVIEILEEALDLWRGDPYPEVADVSDGIAERTRLGELRLSALEDLMDAELSIGQHQALVGRLEDLVARNPLRERLWGQLMLALYRSGRQSEALRAYQRLRRVLGDELGIEPSLELQDLENQILLQDSALGSTGMVSTPRTNLRPPLTSFVGRSQELGEVSELLSSSRLVTLTGSAGSGKTRLAVEVAQGQLDGFPDGVWFADLAPLTSPDEVAAAIAAPLGVSGQSERPTEAILKDYLGERRLQLVLDNCEHLVGKVAHLVAELLQTDPNLTVLATSRERLGVAGEVTYEVPPLPIPDTDEARDIEVFDAVRLFVDRARAADPHFALAGANTEAVAEICRRLDGIPLAIELAAARVHGLPPGELTRHLDDRFAVLVSPLRTELGRHQTLQAAVDWSYELLEPAEQTLFRRLSVFRGGFDLEAAEQVCGLDPLSPAQVLTMVPELVDKSLVVVDNRSQEQIRYRLLETLREYGQERLDATEAGAVRDSHASYFLALVERAFPELHGREQQVWIKVLAAEHDNLRKALRWSSSQDPETAIRMAIALADYWDSVGPRLEGHEWLRRAVVLADSTTPELRIKAGLAAGDLFSSAHASHPLRFAEEALREARLIGDELAEAQALRAVAWALTLEEHPEEAIRYGTEALEIFERLGERWEMAHTLERLGQADYPDPARSIEDFERSLALYREAGDRKREAVVLYKLADRLAQAVGDFDAAVAFAEESISICEEIGNTNDEAHALLEYGKILRRRGDPERAYEVLERALQLLSRSGDERCSVRTLTAMGTTLIDRGDTDAAHEVLQASLRRGADLDEKHTSRVAIAGTARLLASSGRLDEAATLYGFAEKLGREIAVPVTEASQQKRTEFVERLRSEMDPEDFARAREAGEAMDLEEAIAFAMGASTSS